LGKLPNTMAMEGHTDSKPDSEGAKYGNWELSADPANVTRRLMQANGIRLDQVTQVRGFADERLCKKDDPLDPANRRIALIVQYLNKTPKPEDATKEGEAKDGAQELGANQSSPAKENAAQEPLRRAA
jgi:chemotaxis protein MotB